MAAVAVDPIDLQGIRSRRAALVREIERCERDLEEATAALTLPVARAAQIA
jgi:hypothetical protein